MCVYVSIYIYTLCIMYNYPACILNILNIIYIL